MRCLETFKTYLSSVLEVLSLIIYFHKMFLDYFSNSLTTISMDSSEKIDFGNITGLSKMSYYPDNYTSHQLRVRGRNNLEFCTMFFDFIHQFSKNVRLCQILKEKTKVLSSDSVIICLQLHRINILSEFQISSDIAKMSLGFKKI